MIPQTAHVIWLGAPMPTRLRDMVRGFERLHPDWTLQWWGEHDLHAFGLHNHELYERAGELVPADSVHQLRSDVARYEILLRHGGLYIDADFVWRQPIDPYTDGRDFLIGWETQDVYVANGLIGSVAGHPVLRDMVDTLHYTVDHNPNGRDWRANRITGTHVLTPIVRCHGVQPVSQSTFCAVPWNRPELADDPTRWPDAVAVHTWNHQREIRGLYND